MTLTPDRLKRVLDRYHRLLRRHRDALNRLNVYPVPDGDTGTNMALTVQSVIERADGAMTMDELAEAIAEGSLMGARGNSGVILSQILRGLADAFRHSEAVGSAELVDALDRAADAAYAAVVRPVEGTILTVLREAAEAAKEAGTISGEDLGTFLERVYRRAEDALERTPELLPVLAEAGVVDAGGAGLLLLLAAFLEEVTGEEVPIPDHLLEAARRSAAEPTAGTRDEPQAEAQGPRYEVMYLLDADDDAIEGFKRRWAEIGDSIVVVGGDGRYNAHIHTDDIGAAIEAGIEVGRPHRIVVTDLYEQSAAHATDAGPDPTTARTEARAFTPRPEFVDAPVGVVAVVAGEGLIEAFRDLGAQGVVVGGQTMNPSTEELLRVVEAVPAPTVVVLPNNRNIIPVARQLDALTTKRVIVVPTRSVAEGLAAMVAYVPDPDADPETAGERIAEAMAAAADAVTTLEVTRAVRDARTDIGAIRAGDWLGLVDDEIRRVGSDLGEVLVGLVDDTVADDAELVTVVLGAEADREVTASLQRHLADHHPNVEVEVIDGGQPLYPYVLGVE